MITSSPNFGLRTLARRESSNAAAWFQNTHSGSALNRVAYFSMEFGLSEALPIYSGGLGNVAGDQLKAGSDYDMLLAERIVEGVDVWINTPRRPWEASGTSGMKVLANGGVNLSELDGWWAEAYEPEVGWALGDGREHGDDPGWDAAEALRMYDILEHEVIASPAMTRVSRKNSAPQIDAEALAPKMQGSPPVTDFDFPHSRLTR